MASLWRKRRSGKKIPAVKKIIDEEIPVPSHFRCPISLDLMADPVIVPTGITYDRHCIETWLEMAGNTTCPISCQPLGEVDDFIPNHSLRKMIQQWCISNQPHGIERIPTPTIPVGRRQAAEMLAEITAASRRGEAARCQKLVVKVRALAKESERNRRSFASNNATRVLADAFASAAGGAPTGLLEEVLIAAMAGVFPLDEEAAWIMSAPEALTSLLSMIGSSNAVSVIKEILFFIAGAGDRGNAVTGMEGLKEALVNLIKHPISPQATKASLVAIFYMMSSGNDGGAAAKFLELGLVPIMVETLVDAEKSTCEKALAVLDGLLSCRNGRREAYGHALTLPAVAKRMFRVSETATEFAVSVVWRLCRKWEEEDEEEERERSAVQALQVGTFQKVLILLQVGRNEATKEKATEILKILNGYRGRDECIESMDFKGLKRSF